MDAEKKKALEDAAEAIENRAKEINEEAELRKRIKVAKEKEKAARLAMRENAGTGLNLNWGSLGMSRGMKIIVIIVGTLVLFALMKVMGC